DELLACSWQDQNRKIQKVELDDILYITPYNLQVAKITKKIEGANVGTVDRFQGEQAPIVILSMCATDGESAQRGLDFILEERRINVAISRAKALAIVVGSPEIRKSRCDSVEKMKLLNTYCRIMKEGTTGPLDLKGENNE
ncbi:MAG: hypothetical protein HQK54_06670, partial [Oligoflexales bacterium]|nr:hypothetical protein [Oligoflexales bacterium]